MKRLSQTLRTTLLLLIFVAPFVISGCKDNKDNGTGPDTGATIAATARNSSDFTTLYSLLERVSLTGVLDGTDKYTVFAPTEDAFAAFPAGTLDNLTDAQVEQILKYHVIAGEVTSSDLSAIQSVASLLGDNLYVEKDGGNVTVNGSTTVTDADIMATNGVIHGVDHVILPRGIRDANLVDVALDNGNFNTLTQAVIDAGLEGTLSYKGPFTVFAPSDDAFSKLPAGTLSSLTPEQLSSILTYHVVSGEVNAADLSDGDVIETLQGEKLYVSIDNGNVMINGQTMVTQADVSASNGVIHVLDNVLMPDAFGTVVADLQKRPEFSTLVGAVVQANLADALSGDGPFTVFAPTNAAFDKLPAGTLDNLTPEQLTEVLQYHVINADIRSMDLGSEQEAETLTGEKVYVTKDEQGNVYVNGTVMVTQADLVASNGVIHAVDNVLLPRGIREPNIVDVALSDNNFSTLAQAVTDAGLVNTLSYTGPYTVFAPTNAAFDNLPAGTLSSLTPEQLTSILTYHVVAGAVNAADLSDGDVLTTLQGEKLYVSTDNGSVMINGQTMVTQADVSASNGVIHVLDNVLMPDAFGTVVADLQKRPDFSTLVGAVDQANLADALSGDGPFTVFAPDNAAFDQLPAGTLSNLTGAQLAEILQYHVINADIRSMDLGSQQEAETLTGEKVFVTKDTDGNVYVNGNAMVAQADLVASNGVIHVVDNVLMPNKFLDVAGIVSKRYDLGTLTGALQSAGLVTTLQGDGPFTVFAPSNAAFDALPAGTLDGLTTQELTDILTYHVLPAKYLSTDLGASQTVTTVNGSDVTITVNNGTVSINSEATVQIADLEGTNGVVHIIDAVLMPPSN